MGFTKDLWTRTVTQPDGTTKREHNDRWGKGKRWLSVWHDESGAERSRAFATKDPADKHWQAMETDRERGEYLDPKAGRELLSRIGRRWIASRVVDPSTAIRYESLWRLHVEPTFGRRQVRAIRASQIQSWLARLDEKFGTSTAAGAYLVLQGCFDLAIADEMIKKNPAKSRVVKKPRAGLGGKVEPWSDARVGAVIDAHPEHLRLLPVLMTGCGLRIGEATAVALEDFDFAEKILHVRRQLKMLGREHIYALPKNDLERDVPLPDWVAAAVHVQTASHPPGPARLRGRSSRASRRPTTYCSAGPTKVMSAIAPTASRPESRPLPQLGSSRSRAPTAAGDGGTRPRAKRGLTSSATSTPA